MNTPNIIAAGQIAFGLIGMLMGWISSETAIGIITIGLGVFGLHRSNVQLGRSLGAVH